MPLPLLPVPESSHYSGMSYDTPTALMAPLLTHVVFMNVQSQPHVWDIDVRIQSIPSLPSPVIAIAMGGTMPRALP